MCRPGSADQTRSSNAPGWSVVIITVLADRISSPTRLLRRAAVRPRRLAGRPSRLTSRSTLSSMITNPPASAPVSSRRLAAIRSSTECRSRCAFMSATTSPSRRTTWARSAMRCVAASSCRLRRSRFTDPITWPAGELSTLVSMRTSTRPPSLRARRVAYVRGPPARARSSTALCSAFSSSGTDGGSRPMTSAALQPNMRSAAGFHSRTVPSVSNATMASGAESITARAVAPTRICVFSGDVSRPTGS